MSSTRPVVSVSNTELYDRWAQVYDTDGNILQAIDDNQLPALLHTAFALFPSTLPVSLLELGCGTGRNTAKLLHAPYSLRLHHITALDLSASMLAHAKARCTTNAESAAPITVFHQYDALQPADLRFGQADIVLSTLVLEHLPLGVFFATCRRFLGETGVLVLTNMHADMGRQSQAGFVDEMAGTKVRGTSFVYEVRDVVDAARLERFEVIGDVQERSICEEDLGTVVGARGAKWVGVKVWFGIVLRLGGDGL